MPIKVQKNAAENITVILNESEDLSQEIDKENIVTVHLSGVGTRGRVGIVFRGDYDNTTQYFQGDAVRFNGAVYIVTTVPPIGTDPTDGGNPAVVDPNWAELIGSQGDTILVEAHGNMPAGTLQNALDYLEDKHFVEATAPVASATQLVNEGDLWYDETNDKMNVYRNGTWRALTMDDALSGVIDGNLEIDGGMDGGIY